MARRVETVTGAVTPGDLGRTLMHEHFCFGYPGWYGDLSLGANDPTDLLAAGLAMAERAKVHGVRTVVDATPNDCGRSPELLREISERTGINIICSTGYYFEEEGAPVYFKFRRRFGDMEQEIYEMFLHELTVGIGKSGIKAGVIKVASGKGKISHYEQAFFRAAARAQKETGAPIITHTQEGTMGPEQVDLLLEHGADPSRIMIGHMEGNADLNYHLSVLQKGVTVGIDRYGIQMLVGMPTDQIRNALVMGLVGAGFARQLCLSHDYVGTWLGRPIQLPEMAALLMANWHVGNLFENVIPALQEGGVTQAQIDQIVVGNPARLFGAAG